MTPMRLTPTNSLPTFVTITFFEPSRARTESSIFAVHIDRWRTRDNQSTSVAVSHGHGEQPVAGERWKRCIQPTLHSLSWSSFIWEGCDSPVGFLLDPVNPRHMVE